MKKIILAYIILFFLVFSFKKSDAKHCMASFNVGGTIYNVPFYILSTSVDTLFNVGDIINLPISASTGSIGSCICNTDNVWWTHNGIHISNSVSFTVIDTGVYIIHENVSGGVFCVDDVDSFQLTLHVGYRIANSVNEISNTNILQIYPNPTKSTFTIRNISSGESLMLQIMNSIGEVVFTEKLFGKNENEVNANFARGIYFVRVGNDARKLVVE